MKAELVLMGKRIDMAPRAHRRTLVVLIYLMMALLLACLWLLDRWRSSGFLPYFSDYASEPVVSGWIQLRRSHQAIQ